MKTCTKCGVEKPLTEYNRQADCVGGLRPDCKACINERSRQSRERRKEELRQYDRDRYRNQPGRREASIANARKAYWSQRDAQLAYRKAYYQANPEVYERARQKRMALERGAEHQPYSRTEIYERDEGRCRGCQKPLENIPNGFHIDHIVPISLGGPDIPANVQLMCGPCNRAKWANLEGQIHLPV